MNPGVLNKVITIQKIDYDTEKWTDYFTLRAKVNKARGSEYFGSGAIQNKMAFVFEMRYYPQLAKIFLDTQSYRIKFENNLFDIIDYDDFMFENKNIKLLGEVRG